ncbi:MAG TPA: hypothetical protein PLL43_15705, partial [Accumulibacter sp.]|nr:hypothetical protein [Accumulibacter sp.]
MISTVLSWLGGGAITALSLDEVISQDFVRLAGSRFAAATPFIEFLCDACAVLLGAWSVRERFAMPASHR